MFDAVKQKNSLSKDAGNSGYTKGIIELCLTQRHYGFVIFSIDDLTHGMVNGRKTTEDTFKTGNDGDGVVAGEITYSQQNKQNSQTAKGDSARFLY